MPSDKVTTDYGYFDTGWIKTQTLPGGDDTGNSGQSLPTDTRYEYSYDKQGNQTRWCTERTIESDCQGNDVRRIVTESYFPSGDLETRQAQDDPNSSARTYDYTYDPNGSLASVVDHSLGRTTSFTYDAADRNTKVNDEWTQGTDSLISYDADGNVHERRTDGHFNHDNPDQYDGGKLTTFEYDPLDRETQAIVHPPGSDPIHTVDTAYYPSGQRSAQTTHNGDGSDTATRFSQKWFYTDDGYLSRMQRFDSSGDSTKDQDYTHDVDGNRSKDERGSYGFNARDQLTSWQHGTRDVTYTLNGAGSITEKVDDQGGDSQTTDFTYIPNTDVMTKSSTGGQDWIYCYNASGDLTRIAQPKCDQDVPDGDPKVSYSYDNFDRLRSSQGPDGQPGDQSKPRGYQYDGLDRPYTQCVGGTDVTDPNCPSGDKKTDSYVGMSALLSQQQDASSGSTQSFDYDSSFDRLGIETDHSDGSNSYSSYADSADGSVQALINNQGQVTGGQGNNGGDSYFYDPYGELQNPDGTRPTQQGTDPNPAEAELGSDAQANPFRFQGFYEDSGVKTYDMQARDYRPDIGRFLSQDTLESAGDDFNLEADPLTQDLYAFAGGNPINNTEFDGHMSVDGPSQPLPNPHGLPNKKTYNRALGLQQHALNVHSGDYSHEPAPANTGSNDTGTAKPRKLLAPDMIGNPPPNPNNVARRCITPRPGGGATNGCKTWAPQGGCIEILGCDPLSAALTLASVFGGPLDTLGEKAGAKAVSECVEECGRAVGKLSDLVTGSDRGARGSDEGGQTVRHYTTEDAAQQIERSGDIRPGSSGKAYFTPDRYESAAEAHAKLALPRVPEGYFEIPFSDLENSTPFEEVGSDFGQPGGGIQCTVRCATPIRAARFHRINP